MVDNFVFHESFDSTRTADLDAQPNLAQAQTEALVSLLLGHSLALCNTYAFDSRGVLELVRAVLEARDDVRRGVRPGTWAHKRLTESRPFLLSWYGAGSFFEACAAQLRKFQPIEKRFLLSAWKAIDLNTDRRAQLANALLADPYPEAPAWLDEFPDLIVHFDTLRMLNGYAAEYGRGMAASSEKGTDLLDYLRYYHELGADTGPLRNLAEQWGCPTDIAMTLWHRIDRELHRDKGPEDLSSRSWVHLAVTVARDHEEPQPDLDLLEQLKKLIDTFYNARLAQSAYAEHDFLSSVPRSADVDELKYVNDLAVGVIRERRSDASTPPLAGIFSEVFKAPSDEPELAVKPLRRLFQAYWEIASDDERYLTWQRSCGTVNGLLRDRPPNSDSQGHAVWARRFQESWADHMSLLRRELPDVVRTDDGSLRIIMRPGSVGYEHTHLARPFTSEEGLPLLSDEVDTALATSRYVSNLVRWAQP